MTGADEPAGRPLVVHFSADFPDPIEPRKTEVVRTLLALTADRFEHRVISLNRRTPSLRALAKRPLGLTVEEQAFREGLAVAYGAPPKGWWHRATLEKLGEWIAQRLAADGPLPALIVGHKLTIEGIAAAVVARRLGIPYALSIQGNTDGKILALRPDLAPLFRNILRGASALFPFTPWALADVVKRLGAPGCPIYLLPCPTALDQPMPPTARGNGVITAFHLRNWRTKNFDTLVRGYRAYRADGGVAPLAIVGGGEASDFAACRREAGKIAGIRFEGALSHVTMPARLNAATALVMPSRRESFGLVFIEALFAGCPVIYPAGRAIDGYFDEAPFAIRVDHRRPDEIAAAMALVVREEAALKASLAEWQGSRDAERFRRPAIAREFAAGIESALDAG